MAMKQEIKIPVDSSAVYGNLTVFDQALGIVIFAHGSGSSRFSSRNNYVADLLNKAGFATLLFDLLTPEEEQVDIETREFRFNIPLLAERLTAVAQWVLQNNATLSFPIGYFGASTGAAAALISAVQLSGKIAAVVSRGGRVDLAGTYLTQVTAPTLLIVGALDDVVIGLNQEAYDQLTCTKNLVLIDGATHLFEEPGTLQEVTKYAIDWFGKYLPG